MTSELCEDGGDEQREKEAPAVSEASSVSPLSLDLPGPWTSPLSPVKPLPVRSRFWVLTAFSPLRQEADGGHRPLRPPPGLGCSSRGRLPPNDHMGDWFRLLLEAEDAPGDRREPGFWFSGRVGEFFCLFWQIWARTTSRFLWVLTGSSGTLTDPRLRPSLGDGDSPGRLVWTGLGLRPVCVSEHMCVCVCVCFKKSTTAAGMRLLIRGDVKASGSRNRSSAPTLCTCFKPAPLTCTRADAAGCFFSYVWSRVRSGVTRSHPPPPTFLHRRHLRVDRAPDPPVFTSVFSKKRSLSDVSLRCGFSFTFVLFDCVVGAA